MAGALPEGLEMPSDGALDRSVRNHYSPDSFSAYLHIPFCSTRCGYCDFNTYTASELRGVQQADFTQLLEAEIDFSSQVLNAAHLPSRSLSTVFFGGGTPTLLPAEQLGNVLNHLSETFGLDENCEVTVEANPDTLSPAYVAKLATAGVTRVSIGMQSADADVLSLLERTHNPENVAAAVQAVKAAGLQSSVDLIYGTPGETLQQWQHTIDIATSLETDHISAYSLIVEEGTSLARRIKRGELAYPDDDLNADMYELLDAALIKAGFQWYELSNWSKNLQTQSKHNLAYWNGTDWWGYGPGAHSHIGGQRFWNVKHPAAYRDRLDVGVSPAAGMEVPSAQEKALEQLMLRIRLASGFTIPEDQNSIAVQLLAENLIAPHSDNANFYVLSLPGRLRADEIVRRIHNS